MSLDASMLRRLGLPAAIVGLATSSCDLPAPAPGKPLTNGCYYAGQVAVLRVQHNLGTILVPGDVRQVRVALDSSDGQSGVIFTPGFHLLPGPPIRVRRETDLPSSSMMMMPYTDEPTIMAIADPLDIVPLTRGPDC